MTVSRRTKGLVFMAVLAAVAFTLSIVSIVYHRDYATSIGMLVVAVGLVVALILFKCRRR